jgi:hypothetical protein
MKNKDRENAITWAEKYYSEFFKKFKRQKKYTPRSVWSITALQMFHKYGAGLRTDAALEQTMFAPSTSKK